MLETIQPRPNRKPMRPVDADGVRFAVQPCGVWWEVRCRTYEKGRLAADQLVAVFPHEREADDAARALAGVVNT